MRRMGHHTGRPVGRAVGRHMARSVVCTMIISCHEMTHWTADGVS